MQRFTQLYFELDETNRTSDKLAALERYFGEADAADAAWALYFLTGQRLKRLVQTKLLRAWVTEAADLPDWIVDTCYDRVGDLAETMALLLPDSGVGSDVGLRETIEGELLPMRDEDDDRKRERMLAAWGRFDRGQRFVWNKLITGGFRVGVQRTLVARALGAVAEVPQAVMAHRLMGHWSPTADDYRRLLEPGDGERDPAQPYPFFLASPLEQPIDELGAIDDWQVEWKWDGIRAQLLQRDGRPLLWTRGEELVSQRYPEVLSAAERLPRGVVLDGELLAWRDERPLPFSVLQRRIGRKRVGAKLLAEAPVALVAYDLLELDGEDLRESSLEQRRERLGEIVGALDAPALRLSPRVEAPSWAALTALREESRERQVEGFILKRKQSPYRVGRVRGDWWKWKVDPFQCDAVLIQAQRGHGRRAGLFTDYTFGVWDGDALVPVAKAYSGLDQQEIRAVDRFIRDNTVDRFGPVTVVRPELVFELHFEGIRRSPRHKSGIAVRFPRMARWRRDKAAEAADTLQTLRGMLGDEQSIQGPASQGESSPRPVQLSLLDEGLVFDADEESS